MKSVLFFIGCLILISACRKNEKTVTAAQKMQEFVIEISNYSKSLDSDFLIIPQNGEALAYVDANPDLDLQSAYLNAIDAFAVEAIFYNGDLSIDTYRLNILRKLVLQKSILVSEFISDNSNIADAQTRNFEEGFLCFPRSASNYDYLEIPASPFDENADDIDSITKAKNYLYLISTNAYSTKQTMIDAIAVTNYDLVIIDLFFDDISFTAAEIQQLKTKANGGQRLILAYMSIGSAENYRYYWQSNWRLHNPDWLEKKYDGYKDEIWVEYWNQAWKDIIYGNNDSYTKKIIDAGFDGVYLDNVEAYYSLYHRK